MAYIAPWGVYKLCFFFTKFEGFLCGNSTKFSGTHVVWPKSRYTVSRTQWPGRFPQFYRCRRNIALHPRKNPKIVAGWQSVPESLFRTLSFTIPLFCLSVRFNLWGRSEPTHFSALFCLDGRCSCQENITSTYERVRINLGIATAEGLELTSFFRL